MTERDCGSSDTHCEYLVHTCKRALGYLSDFWSRSFTASRLPPPVCLNLTSNMLPNKPSYAFARIYSWKKAHTNHSLNFSERKIKSAHCTHRHVVHVVTSWKLCLDHLVPPWGHSLCLLIRTHRSSSVFFRSLQNLLV